jgi:hypothetical protein
VRTFFGTVLPAIIVLPMEAQMDFIIGPCFLFHGGYKTYQILAEWLQIIDMEELVSNLEVIAAELLLEPLPATAGVQPPPTVNSDSSSPLVSSRPMDAVVSSINTTDSSESSITTSTDTQSRTSSLVGQHIAENDSLSRSTDTTSDSTTESQSRLLPQ